MRIRGFVAVIATVALLVGLSPAVASADPPAGHEEKVAANKARKLLKKHRRVVHAEGSTFTVTDVIVDPDETTHVRFDRTYRDLPVLGGDLVVHLDANGVLLEVSQTLTTDLNVNVTPSISAAQAATAAGAAGPHESQLVVDAAGAAPYLAWGIEVAGTQYDGTPSQLTTYVDAHTGQVVRREEAVHTAGGEGFGYHVGHVPLETTAVGASYELKDPSRANNYTADAGDLNKVFGDADNQWGDGTLSHRQTVAVDAQYSLATTWDYFLNVHGRNGIRNDGAGSHNRVHYGTNYNNAFWDPRCFCMGYGDGDGVSRGPFASLDVVAHEMTHGVTGATAKLIYGGESGALNEATSDIFGTLLEFHANNPADPPDYTLAEKVSRTTPLRWMDDPAKDGESASCWSSGVGNLGVHNSSGVGNHFFYLLAVGSGASQWGNSPTCNGSTVVGIGNEAAGRIWYRALTVYMTSATNYAGARVATLNAARDLYGASSVEYDAVAAAWLAVKVVPVADSATLSIDDVAVNEGHSGTTTATFSVSLSAALTEPATVDFATVDGSAVAPGDYAAATGRLTFVPGETTKAVSVAVNGDTAGESDEIFTLDLSNPTRATIDDGRGTATILDDDSWAVSVDDVAVTEGSGATATFTVSVSGPPRLRPVTVDYATADGTATAPADYAGATGSLSFAPGETAKTVSVPITDDTVHERDESFALNLSRPVGAQLGDSNGLATVRDDDALSVSVSDATVGEADGYAVFVVSLSTTSAVPVTVDYASADGTALAGRDYLATAARLSFSPGETAKPVGVWVIADNVDESSETFILGLSSTATIADGEGVGTIVDDDGTPSVSVGDIGVVEGDAGTTPVTFQVSLSGPSGSPVTVDYSTADGTAAAPGDYVTTAGTLTFAPGETAKTVTSDVNGDTVDEPDETFLLNLSNPTQADIGDGQATARILDNDQPPSLSVSDPTVTEGNAGTTPMEFAVSLSTASALAVTVDYATADASAVAPGDYVTVAGTLTFAPGETAKTVPVGVNGDTADEADEVFGLNLSNPTQATIGNSQGTATIVDDDSSVSVSDAAVTEGNAGPTGADFTVSLSGPLGQPVTLDYATADSSAVAPGDYATATGSLTFAPGETTKTVTVTVNGDTIDELDETFMLNVVNVVGASVADSVGFGTILDDDVATPVTAPAMAWGNNSSGQLGDGTYDSRPSPGAVSGLNDVVALDAAYWHNLVVRSDGTVWGWGQNGSGLLGNGETTAATTPVQAIGITDGVAVAGGYSHSLVLRADGTVWGMGNNRAGQLGPDRWAAYHTPVQVPGYADIVAIDVGDDYNLALRRDGTLWASGSNGQGELGDGTRDIRTSPVQVQVPGVVVDMAAGWDYAVAVLSDGSVWSWGDDGDGIWDEGDRLWPEPVPGLTNAVAVAAGAGQYLALRSDGTVWAWGNNSYGQVGNGTTNRYPERVETPVQVQGLANVVSIAAGNFHGLALRADGTVWAWGGNWEGQLGLGHNEHPQPSAVQVPGLSGVTAVSAGDVHSIVILESP